MHPRVSLHQVAFVKESNTAFIDHCRAIGVANMVMVTPLLMTPGGLEETERALAAGGPLVHCVNHPGATIPDIERDEGEGQRKLGEAIDLAAALGARLIYLLTGARGGLDWEQAAERFATLIAPSVAAARAQGITLLVENASAFNADIHIAHTLGDAVMLAEIANVALCIDLQPCWAEAGLKTWFRRAVPRCGLVQVSDYVLGDRSAPCRAVPGDGAIPLERLIGDILEAGYDGVFDLELVGPRIDAEGPREASRRAAERLSEMLTRLGA